MSSLTLLALETSTLACSVALLFQNNISEKTVRKQNQHSELILPMIDELLSNQKIEIQTVDAIVFGCGPGSFTGVRIACSVAKTIAFAINKPLIGISTLELLAITAHRIFKVEQVLATIDARMDQVYWGTYQLNSAGQMELVGTEQVSHPNEIILPNNKSWHVVGSGVDHYKNAFCNNQTFILLHDQLPNAYDLIELGQIYYQQGKIMSAKTAQPNYVRNNITS